VLTLNILSKFQQSYLAVRPRLKWQSFRNFAKCDTCPPRSLEVQVDAKPQPSKMAYGISTASIGNVAAQLCRGNWLADKKLRLPKKQASCRSFAQVLGSAVGTTRVTLVHASPRIYRRPSARLVAFHTN
jgi:hypothetical protein